jgi:hypothetical protein
LVAFCPQHFFHLFRRPYKRKVPALRELYTTVDLTFDLLENDPDPGPHIMIDTTVGFDRIVVDLEGPKGNFTSNLNVQPAAKGARETGFAVVSGTNNK